jgi:BirA family transcriptional regulator, biotin operon repressor / biotin---[acetyl-CoA-carboxylase] ligase
MLATLLAELEADYGRFLTEGLEPIRQEWRERLVTLGRRVTVEDGAAQGMAEDVDETGALLLRLDNGVRRRITVGDAIVA